MHVPLDFTVLVTGANGFVGGHLCRHLGHLGCRVRAGVRGKAAALQVDPRCQIAQLGDLTQDGSWQQHLAGVDVVVHLVARTHVMREQAENPLALYRAVNVDATRRLFEASCAAGVKRFIYLSSIKAVGEGGPQAYSETTPCRPEDDYGRSKREAEQLLLAATDGPQRLVVRTPLIYGPGVKGNFPRLLRLAGSRWPLPLGAIDNQRSLIYVGNLVDALARAATAAEPLQGVLHVADRESPSTAELVERLGECLTSRPRLVPVPVPLLRAAGRLLGCGAEAERLTKSLLVDTRESCRRLQWDPPFTLQQGLRHTVRWFQQPMRTHVSARETVESPATARTAA